MPNRVLITGGCGFIASHLAETLLEIGGYELMLFDNMFRSGPDNLPREVREGGVYYKSEVTASSIGLY